MVFETIFFDQIIDRTLFYSPKIEIKPAHLANGFDVEAYRAALRIVITAQEIVVGFVHTASARGVSAARSSSRPRCKLTRTEPGAKPVRSAISGPVMSSSKRIIRVSR